MKMSLGTSQPFHDFGMGFMNMVVCHALDPIPQEGIRQEPDKTPRTLRLRKGR